MDALFYKGGIILNKKEVIVFRKNVPPNSKGRIMERVKDNGTIEKLMLRFYMGQELKLGVWPYIKHNGNKIESMVTIAGDETRDNLYLTGDDDQLVFDVVIPVYYDDEIIVEYENTSSEYEYNLVCDITIDYYLGTDRIVGGVI